MYINRHFASTTSNVQLILKHVNLFQEAALHTSYDMSYCPFREAYVKQQLRKAHYIPHHNTFQLQNTLIYPLPKTVPPPDMLCSALPLRRTYLVIVRFENVD